MIHFTRLKSGEWCVRSEQELEPGSMQEIMRKDGQKVEVVIGSKLIDTPLHKTYEIIRETPSLDEEDYSDEINSFLNEW